MRRRLIIFSIIAAVVILAFVITGCSQLSKKESTAEKKFSKMMPELTIRYKKLADATELAQEVGGKRDVVTDSTKALKAFNDAKKKKDVSAELEASRDLETIIGRLRANTQSSPRLNGSPELAASVIAIDESIPSTSVRDPYYDAVASYEDARTSFRNLFSALIGGYNAAQQLEFSFPPDETK